VGEWRVSIHRRWVDSSKSIKLQSRARALEAANHVTDFCVPVPSRAELVAKSAEGA
jgi:hypothetical protein